MTEAEPQVNAGEFWQAVRDRTHWLRFQPEKTPGGWAHQTDLSLPEPIPISPAEEPSA